MTGRIVKGVGGFYTALCEGEKYTLRARGSLRRQKITPTVGDFVEFTPGEEEADGWLERVLERKNSLERPPVANIDIALLQVAACNPQPDLLMLDKLLIICHMAGIDAAVIVSKADLDPDMAKSIAAQYEKSGVPVCMVSSKTGAGLDKVRDMTRSRACAWAGQSGVGKSTIISTLFGLELETGGLSRRTERGRHTTRHVELIDVGEDTLVFDTPGFSLLDLPLMEPMDVQKGYPEFDNVSGCRFAPCAHISEPGCMFKAERESLMSDERYERYKQIFDEMRERWKNRYD